MTNPAPVKKMVFNMNNKVGEQNDWPLSKPKNEFNKYNIGIKIRGNKTISRRENFKNFSPLHRFLLNTYVFKENIKLAKI